MYNHIKQPIGRTRKGAANMNHSTLSHELKNSNTSASIKAENTAAMLESCEALSLLHAIAINCAAEPISLTVRSEWQ